MSTDTLTAPPPDAPEAVDEVDGAAATDAVKAGAESSAPAESAAPESEAPPAVGEFEAQDSAPAPRPGKLAVLLTMPLRVLIAILVPIDLPFAFLGARIKRFIGAVAVVTAVVAAGTWIGGPQLSAAAAAYAKRHPAAPAPSGEPAAAPAHSAKPAAASEHGGKVPAAKAPAAKH